MDGGGGGVKVAAVIVGLSSAVKIPPGKMMDSSLCGYCLTRATIGQHKTRGFTIINRRHVSQA